MKRKNRNRMRGGAGKERVIMLAASVFVLSALTLTGVYVKESTAKKQDDGYSIDLSSLENKSSVAEKEKVENSVIDKAKTEKAAAEEEKSLSVQNPAAEYELDLEAVLEEGEIDNTTLAKGEREQKKESKDETKESNETNEMQNTENENAEKDKKESETPEETGGQSASVSTTTFKTLQFTENTSLVWPTVGDILINYSMDKTVYFPTLAQYKYNPAIVIAAAEGKTIVAAADAQITEIFTDDEIGNAVRMDLGNGYELVYGQLSDIQVSKGAYVAAGDVIGTVGTPTKYYSVEGSNLYVKLTKDGEPLNPLTLLP